MAVNAEICCWWLRIELCLDCIYIGFIYYGLKEAVDYSGMNEL
jgi:hypothetical protein